MVRRPICRSSADAGPRLRLRRSNAVGNLSRLLPERLCSRRQSIRPIDRTRALRLQPRAGSRAAASYRKEEPVPRAERSAIAALDLAPEPAETTATDSAADSSPVPAGESDAVLPSAVGTSWSDTELVVVRADLVTDLAELQREYERSVEEFNDLQLRNSDGAGDDQADAGSRTFDREQDLSIAANRLDLISQLTHAIARVDRGTYGRCEVCGNPIPRVRLEAFPMATLDVECKQREERR